MSDRRQSIGFLAMNADVAIIGIFVILIFFVLHFAGYIFAPVLAAIVVGLMLNPLEAALERRGVPAALAAALLMIASLLLVLVVLFGLVQPLSTWIERTPMLLYKLRVLADAVEEPLRDLTALRENVQAIIGDDQTVIVAKDSGDQVTRAVSAAPELAGQILIFIGALYFFLSGRRRLKYALISIYRSRADQLRTARLIAAAEYSVSHYLAAIAAINLCFGLIVTAAMMAYGLPQPLLWGSLAFALNFIPYLGPAIMTLLIFGGSMMVFPDLAMPFLTAGTYVLLNLTEGQFVTPSIIGRTATMNPFLVFCSLAFGLWFWGAIGAFLAVPILLILRVVVTHSRRGSRHALALAEIRERPGRR